MSGINPELPSPQHDLDTASTNPSSSEGKEEVITQSRRRPSQTRFVACPAPGDRRISREYYEECYKYGLD